MLILVTTTPQSRHCNYSMRAVLPHFCLLQHRLARSLFLYSICNGWIRPGTTVGGDVVTTGGGRWLQHC